MIALYLLAVVFTFTVGVSTGRYLEYVRDRSADEKLHDYLDIRNKLREEKKENVR